MARKPNQEEETLKFEDYVTTKDAYSQRYHQIKAFVSKMPRLLNTDIMFKYIPSVLDIASLYIA